MRHFSSAAAAVIALGALIPFRASGQGSLTITNYQLVSETKITRTVSDFAYRADVVNTTGTARQTLTATVTSSVASTEVIQGSLHFTNVPTNGQVTSTDTFTIRVDRSVAFDIANLHWTFSQLQNPVANGGPNQTVKQFATVTLNGSASTNGGAGTLTYSWAFSSRPAGSTATLTNPTSVNPTFAADLAGQYVVVLTVSNGIGTDSASVQITTTPDTAPVANAGPNQTVALGSTVTLNGSASSDADGDPLTYSWTFVTKPAGSTATLTGANTVSPTFVADKSTIAPPPTNYIVQLIVNDGHLSSNPVTVVISTQNSPPVANAGPGQQVNVGALVTLDGSGSTDVDGDPLTYSWSFTTRPAGSNATLSSTTAVKPTFTGDVQGTYVAQLVVNDGHTNSTNTATVTITTNTVLQPVANAGPNQTITHTGVTVTLNGSASSDPNTPPRPLTYSWTLTTKPAGSTAVLTNPTTVNPTFVADLGGTYVAQLIVNNGVLSSPPATVTITNDIVAPVANAGPNQTVLAGATVALNGSGSNDPDGDPLTYSWTLTTKPAGSTAALSAATTVSPTFVADVVGTYVAQLIVHDPFMASAPATVTITAGSNVIILPATLTVGQNLEESATFSFTPAPANLVFTITSNDPSKLLLSLTPDAAGQTSISFDTGINAGHTVSPPFFVYGLASSGSATYTISASGYSNATGTANFAPSAFVIVAPSGIGQPFQTTSGGANTGLTIVSVMLDSGMTQQAVRGGITVNVPVTSSNTGVGTITTSPVVFTGGVASAGTQFHPVAPGTTNVQITTPAGFSTAATGNSVQVTVATPRITVTDGISIGKGLQQIGQAFINQQAPAGGLAITLTSNSPNLKLSLSPTTAGSSSIVVNIPANGTSGQYYIQVLTDTGSGTYTGTATGFNSGTGTIAFRPSGVVIFGPFGLNSPFPLSTTVANGPLAFTVATYRLFPGTLSTDTDGQQQLAGGSSLSIVLNNSNPSVGTVPSPVAINGGSDSVNPLFTPLSVGTTTISVIKPAAFSQPSDNTTLQAKVNP